MHDSSQKDQFYSNNHDDNYTSTRREPDESSAFQNTSSIKWTASEFVHHEKKITWYIGLALITLGTAIASYFALSKDFFTIIIVVILGIVFGIAAARKPRVLEYTVDDYGVFAGQKHYKYEDFKSFSLDTESAISSLVFMPAQRFSPTLTLYVPNENIGSVMDLVGMYLPIEQHETGYVDRLLNRIKF